MVKRRIPDRPRVPDHELLKPIGGGSYGTVWLARNILGSHRAVKILHRRQFSTRRPYDREYAGLMRYEPLSRGHPGLVSILHVGLNAEEEYFYAIMDLADDRRRGRGIDPASYEPRTLRSDLDCHERWRVPECARIGMALASALGYLHGHGLVHRDVKPSNIIFVEGEPRFADIGLVERIGEASTFVGSEGYTPPEGPGKPTADIYGLGKVLFEVVTGQEEARYPQLPDGFDGWPDAAIRRQLLDRICRACHLNPHQRYQTAQEFFAELQVVLEQAAGGVGQGNGSVVVPAAPFRVVIIGDLESAPIPEFIARLGQEMGPHAALVSTDRPAETSLEWARQIERDIAQADAVLVLLTAGSIGGEMLAYEIQLAQAQAAEHQGRPAIIPILIGLEAEGERQVIGCLGTAQLHRWRRDFDWAEGVREVCALMRRPLSLMDPPAVLRVEAVGGAVPLDSPWYLERAADQELRRAILQHQSIILIKGARQMGKTSLLARGLQAAREQGLCVVNTDLQQLNMGSLASIDHLYLAFGNALADALDLGVIPEAVWDSRRLGNANFDRYVRREVLGRLTSPLVWGIDELDRLLACPFATEVFALMRSWHNNRALDPTGPWGRLTLVLALATEAHLIMPDLSQSPFNVGVRVLLSDFTIEQVDQLNRLHGRPLGSAAELERFQALLGGQPYLVRRGLQEMTMQRLTFEELLVQADQEEGAFTDHLRRLLTLLAKDAVLVQGIRDIVSGHGCSSTEAFHRLHAAGVVQGSHPASARLRCELYQVYLRRFLVEPSAVGSLPAA
jgi:serine/threonine protein kinase